MAKSKRKFKWDAWDFDLCGSAYVIAKDECPSKEDVPDFICRVDGIDPTCKPEMVVQEGWCKFEVRTDWDNGDGKPQGGYVVELGNKPAKNRLGNPKSTRGWFPVWVVRKDEWY